MHLCNSASIRYWPLCGLCCPLYPLPTQQSCDCLSRRELSTFIPSLQSFCSLHCSQPDCFQRKSGSTLRVMSTLVCQSDLSGLRSGSVPRPPLRTFSPKNPTKEKRSPWTLSSEGQPPWYLLNYSKFDFYHF